VDLPTTILPLVAAARWDRQAVERIADALDQGGVAWAR